MKKIISLFAIVASLAAVGAAQSLDSFQSAFATFADDMASSLALNATTGSNWSDAYVGGFPHFGVGVAAGASFTGKGSAEPLFSALGQAMPDVLAKAGVPIPAAALTCKIGLPFAPIDIGLTGGYIPPSIGSKLEGATGVSVDYANIGGQIRVAVLKEKLILPDVSLGFGASYQKGGITAKMGTGNQTIVNQSIGGHTWLVQATDPDIDLGWESMTYDATLQVSKKILFFRPYAGVGYSFGKATVTGGVASDLTFKRDSVASDYVTLANDLRAAGETPPELSATGFTYSAEAKDPLFRVYGGLSFSLLINLDTQVIYVPETKAFGASVALRFQI